MERRFSALSIFLMRVAKARDSWIHQLMMRELSDPTPALDLVIKHVVRPRLEYLRSVVAALLDRDCDDAVVEQSVMSVQSQCLAPLTNRVALRSQPRVMTEQQVETLAAHITQFSLAGIRTLSRRPATRRARRARRGRPLHRP